LARIRRQVPAPDSVRQLVALELGLGRILEQPAKAGARFGVDRLDLETAVVFAGEQPHPSALRGERDAQARTVELDRAGLRTCFRIREPDAIDGDVDHPRALRSGARGYGLGEGEAFCSASCVHAPELSSGYALPAALGDVAHRVPDRLRDCS